MSFGRRCTTALLVAMVLATVRPVHAEEVVSTSFPTQLFEPAMGLDALFTVEGPQVAEHLGFTVGVMFNYQYQPLVLKVQRNTGATTGAFDPNETIGLVDHQFTTDILASLSLRYRWFKAQVGLNLPLHVTAGVEVNDQVEPTFNYEAFGLGEIKMQIKVMLLDDLGGFSLALSPVLTFPTGQWCDYCGDAGVGVRPRLVAGYRWKDLSVAANLGYLIRQNALLFSSEVSDQMIYGVGASYRVHDRVTVMGEIYGRIGFDTESGCKWDLNKQERICTGGSSGIDKDAVPTELAVGVRVPVWRGIDFTGGVGVGLNYGIGTPKFRLIAGLRWAPDFRDLDNDGVYDRSDKCPAQPEDIDTFQDDDGCPDPDNDGDMIIDARDRCPLEAEDKDTFEDDDGCPEKDNDKDGIDDLHDHCPLKPETKNNFRDEDGCPDVPDGDNDGVQDNMDKCPQEQEDRDKFQDEDGCPDPDNDMDEVPDDYDDCPIDPEDMDGFEDDDGCPDPDNDMDGVPDKQDQCADEKETINGRKDDDGCPDSGASQVVLEEGRIAIRGVVEFKAGTTSVEQRSHALLQQVALTIKANPQLKKVRIDGHADVADTAAKDKEISLKRAQEVRGFLVMQGGVKPDRLVAVGFGRDKPKHKGRDKISRIKNGRIEFSILELKAPKK